MNRSQAIVSYKSNNRAKDLLKIFYALIVAFNLLVMTQVLLKTNTFEKRIASIEEQLTQIELQIAQNSSKKRWTFPN